MMITDSQCKVVIELMINYCMMTHLQHYLMALILTLALYALLQGFSSRHAHNSIYLSYKYADLYV